MLKLNFSIIIPTYNSEKTLRRCLDSIISQNFQNFEIWIIDGLSLDNTVAIIEQYKLRYSFIKYISETDKGIYDAMNKGIGLSVGKWIYFLGSDDTLFNEHVLSMVAENEKYSAGLVMYGNVVMRGKNQWNLDGVTLDGEYNLAKLLNRNICHQAIFYHRKVFTRFGLFDIKYNVGADFDFNLRCFANTAFTYMNLIVADFYIGGYSSNNYDHEIIRNRGAMFLKYFKYRIYNKSFINSRLYLHQAALSSRSPLNLPGRAICLGAYLKLKLQSWYLNILE
jgi:glycosyltransferase involved in cell wall biosynthesis